MIYFHCSASGFATIMVFCAPVEQALQQGGMPRHKFYEHVP